MPRLSARDAAIYAFLALGLLRMAGLFLPGGVNRFARTLALSPNPTPFLAVRAYRGDSARGIWLECKRKDGASTRTQWGPELRAGLPGPQPLVGFYSGALGYFESSTRPLLAPEILSRVVCRDTALALAAGCGTATESAALTLHTFEPGSGNVERNFRWNCAEVR
jgi:hypothetical protein